MISEFDRKVYELVRKVPRGKVTTYKAIAQAMHIKAYRAIGQSLRKNPFAPKVPCHRIVRSDGSIGGFKGKMDGSEKAMLLLKEGVKIKKGKVLIFEGTTYLLK